jgi:hypothetical protein
MEECMNTLSVIKKKIKGAKAKTVAAGSAACAGVVALASSAFAAGTPSIDLGTSGIQTAIDTAQANYELVFMAIVGFIVVMWGLTRLKSVFFK